jgi:hypothetical protein
MQGNSTGTNYPVMLCKVIVLTGGNGVDIAERYPDSVAASTLKCLAEGTVSLVVCGVCGLVCGVVYLVVSAEGTVSLVVCGVCDLVYVVWCIL